MHYPRSTASHTSTSLSTHAQQCASPLRSAAFSVICVRLHPAFVFCCVLAPCVRLCSAFSAFDSCCVLGPCVPLCSAFSAIVFCCVLGPCVPLRSAFSVFCCVLRSAVFCIPRSTVFVSCRVRVLAGSRNLVPMRKTLVNFKYFEGSKMLPVRILSHILSRQVEQLTRNLANCHPGPCACHRIPGLFAPDLILVPLSVPRNSRLGATFGPTLVVLGPTLVVLDLPW
jgi:hypothetical protein